MKTIIVIFVAQGTGKCIDYEYAGFHCVPIYQCNNDGVIRTAAQGLFDPRYSVQVLNMLASVLHSWYKRCKPMNMNKFSLGAPLRMKCAENFTTTTQKIAALQVRKKPLLT